MAFKAPTKSSERDATSNLKAFSSSSCIVSECFMLCPSVNRINLLRGYTYFQISLSDGSVLSANSSAIEMKLHGS